MSAILLVFSVFCVTQKTMEMLAQDGGGFVSWFFLVFFVIQISSLPKAMWDPTLMQFKAFILIFKSSELSVFKSHSTFQWFSTFPSFSGGWGKLWWDSRINFYSKIHRRKCNEISELSYIKGKYHVFSSYLFLQKHKHKMCGQDSLTGLVLRTAAGTCCSPVALDIVSGPRQSMLLLTDTNCNILGRGWGQ